MTDEKNVIERLKEENLCMAKVIAMMCRDNSEFSGNLSPKASYRLTITGPFGKKEFGLLIKRLQLETKVIGETMINEQSGQSVQKLVAEALKSESEAA